MMVFAAGRRRTIRATANMSLPFVRAMPVSGLRSILVLLICLAIGGSAVAPARAQGRKTTKNQNAITSSVGTYSSTNFRLVTDLPQKEAQELLTRLETMLKLVSGYFGKRNTKTIDRYVARDFDAWPAAMVANLDPLSVAMVKAGGGITHAQTALLNGRAVDAQAVVYATADHGTPQHEAVHAYCSLAFGACGPVWYSEGMAEVGQYWKEGDKGVNASAEVIRYLHESDPKPLDEIVNSPLETTGDSWQNYAWRWALCHLLGHNENYTDRFKPLGLAMLNRQDIDFWQVYGAQAVEIAFEYVFFLQHIEPGYRVDLCSWDWKAKFAVPKKLGSVCKVNAGRGWQASKFKLTAGESYAYDTTGEWQVEANGEKLSADGDHAGAGRLVGCLYKDYELTSEFELGTRGEIVAPSDGDLFVRCRDGWGSLADNKGGVTFKLRPAGP
jgi:hypothetical protein